MLHVDSKNKEKGVFNTGRMFSSEALKGGKSFVFLCPSWSHMLVNDITCDTHVVEEGRCSRDEACEPSCCCVLLCSLSSNSVLVNGTRHDTHGVERGSCCKREPFRSSC